MSNVHDLGAWLRTLTARHGQLLAVAGERGSLTFAELDRAADAWAAAFARAGYGQAARVALLAGNRPEWLAVAFGVWRAGATLVPLSTFATARELGDLLQHADPDVLVLQPQLRAHDYLAMLPQLPSLPRLRQVVLLDPAPASPHRDAEAFLCAATAGAAAGIDPESIACILYTSGTTGQAKGVQLSHRAVLATMFPTAERGGLGAGDSLLSTLPLFWVAGLVIRALPTLAAGCALLLVESFTVDAVVDALRRFRPTALHLRPPQVAAILAHPDFSPDLLATVRRGGGRSDWYAPHLAEACLITGYGMTEMAGYVTALRWDDPADVRRAQIGTLLPGVEMRIVSSHGRPCAADDTGEIRVRGPGLFSGYYKQAAGAAMDADGFFITGDLGRIDSGGTFHFVGRNKDLLRVKGINVSPLEVESVLATHSAVEAAYVVGLPPDGLEQRVAALIVPKAGVEISEAALRAHAAAALSHYKRPEIYVFIGRSDVPLSGTSKPQRAVLAALATTRLGNRPA